MMRLLGRITTLLLVIIIAAFVAGGLLLQSSWGALKLSEYLSARSQLQVTFSHLHYRWSSPGIITLDDFRVGQPQQPAFIDARRVDIALALRQLFQPDYPHQITLRDGHIDASAARNHSALRADALVLANMAITHGPANAGARAVSAKLTPWLPLAGKPLGARTEFQAQIGELNLDGQQAKQVSAQGLLSSEGITLTTITGQAGGGSFSGALQRAADGQWHIQALTLNALRLQTPQTLSELLGPLLHGQPVIIDALTINNARLEGNGWAMTDLDLALNRIAFIHGGWQSNNGQLKIQAREAVLGNERLEAPVLDAGLSPLGVVIREASTRWQQGSLSTKGQWLRQTNQLALSELTINNLEYTLPASWRAFANRPLPDWLTRLTVQKLSASHNLLIDIDPAFPWQVTALDGHAQELQLVAGRRWGIWAGHGEVSAQAATFNRTDVLQPSLTFSADDNAFIIDKLTALAAQGKLSATAIVAQDAQRQTHLQLNGAGIEANVLNNWGWPAVNLNGPVDFTLQADASLAAGQALAPSVNATLEMTGSNGQRRHQVMQNGALVR